MTTQAMARRQDDHRTGLRAIADLMRISRQYGTLLVMLPTLWSLFLAADGRPSFSLLLIFILGSFIMRSAGCVINDMADRNFDPLVERTKGRPLASNRLSMRSALAVLAILLSIALGLALMLNRSALLLSVVGALLATLYPFTKRFIQMPQAVMGVAFGWGSVIAWAAVNETVEVQAWLIFAATALWATAYDTLYALQDIDDDRKIGVKSSAIFFCERTIPAVSLLYAGMVALLLTVGVLSNLGAAYYGGLAATAVLLGRQVARVKASPDRDTAFAAFKANVTVGFVVLLGLVVDLHI